MSKYVKMVKEFHVANGLPVNDKYWAAPTIESHRRFRLLRGEFNDYEDTVMRRNEPIGIADTLADMLYTIHGTALVYGFDMDAIFKEVHRSNMSKGPNYSPPNLIPIIFGG